VLRSGVRTLRAPERSRGTTAAALAEAGLGLLTTLAVLWI
jgi:hypothetical protein